MPRHYPAREVITRHYVAPTDRDAMLMYCLDEAIQNLSMEEVERVVITHEPQKEG